MNEFYLILLLLVVGYCSGIFVGILGIGGGVIFVPVLYLILPFTDIDFNQIAYITIATSLFAGSFAALSSGSNHFLKKNVDVKRAFLISSGSIISSSLTPYFVVATSQFYIQIIFVIIFSAISIKMFIENGNYEIKLFKNPLNDNYLFLFGFVIGIIAAFAGIGGGILFVPLLIYFYSIEVKKAVGTSAVATAFTMISSSISFTLQDVSGFTVSYQYGYIYLLAGIPLAVGSATGAFNGVKIQQKTSDSSIKKIFSLVVLIVVIKIIFDIQIGS